MKINNYSILLISFILMLSFLACNNDMDYDVSFDISNSVTGYQYKINISYPNDQTTGHALFVLDAADMVPLVTEAMQEERIGTAVAIIGVDFNGKNERTRDYTPTKDGDNTGEAPEFFEFVTGELQDVLIEKGLINSKTEKTIVGHSLGGLAAAYAFSAYNAEFQNYIILSPALYWHNYSVMGIEQDTRNSILSSRANVFMGIGEEEDLGMQNGFEALKSILEKHYPNVQMQSNLATGSHMFSRKENIVESLNFVLQ